MVLIIHFFITKNRSTVSETSAGSGPYNGKVAIMVPFSMNSAVILHQFLDHEYFFMDCSGECSCGLKHQLWVQVI